MKRLLPSGPADVALAALLVCLAQAEVWTVDDPEGPRIAVALVALAMTLPLLWRRRAPIAVATIVMAALTVASLAWNTPDKTVFPTAAVAVTMYSVAAHCELRRALAGAAIVLGAVFGLVVAVEGRGADFFFIVVTTGSVWIAGRAVRRHVSRADTLVDRTVALEREGEARARAAVADERARIARELHDIVAHSVSVMVVQAGAERRVLDQRQESTREVLLSIERTGRQALVEMRRLLGMLRAEDEQRALAPRPGMAQLDLLVEQIRDAGMPVEVDVQGEPVPLPPGIDLSAYRIVQEALTNALKHAGPARATVTVRYLDHELQLEIADSGRGHRNGNGAGHGLVGMRERAALFGGELHAGTAAGTGFAVQARLPLGSSRG